MQIRLATGADVEQLTGLFDLYRQSLGQPSENHKCRQFVSARLSEGDTMIFIARHEVQALGFIQLYPSYSSVSLKPVWYFDDAFVVELYRGTGIAKGLIAKAKELADSADVVLIKRTLVEQGQVMHEKVVQQKVEQEQVGQEILTEHLQQADAPCVTSMESTQEKSSVGSAFKSSSAVYMYHQAM
jgi:GNAT superfamily N-acetyltransferase